jgi:MFS family permease
MTPAFGFQPTATPDYARLRLARFGVLAVFAQLGMLMATVLSRMPTIRDVLGVSSSGLARLLIFGAIGALVALMFTGWAAAKFGTRALMWWSAIGYFLALALQAFALFEASPELFAAGQFFMSFSFAFANVAMNAEAATVERLVGRAIMPQFHAGFSIGMAIGLGIGAAFSHFGVEVWWHFLIMGMVISLWRLAVIPMAVTDGRPDPDAVAPGLGGPFATARTEYRDKRVLAIGMIIFAGAMTEMTAAQWLSLAVVDDFSRPEAVGDLIYWVFVIAMVSVRWFGASIIGRMGRVVTLRVGAASVATGLLLFAFTPVFWLAPVAAALWGAGAALGIPIGFSAAADNPKRAAASVAAVASFSTIAGLLVPQIVGYLGEVVALREAVLVVLVASATSFALARAVRRDGRLFTSRSREAKRIAARTLAESGTVEP